MILKPYYPTSDLFRLSVEDESLQLDFMTTIHGIRSYNSLKSRAAGTEIGGERILVAALSDFVARKRAANRRATGPPLMRSRQRTRKTKTSRAKTLKALKLESELALRDQIRRLLAKPPGERTHFLRKRIGPGASCL